jgi:hypothetical protein
MIGIQCLGNIGIVCDNIICTPSGTGNHEPEAAAFLAASLEQGRVQASERAAWEANYGAPDIYTLTRQVYECQNMIRTLMAWQIQQCGLNNSILSNTRELKVM